MSKILTVIIFFSIFSNTQAGVCNNNSLSAGYDYSVMGVSSGNSVHAAGRIAFNSGSASFSGQESSNGTYINDTGTGSYTVDPSTCAVTGTISWVSGIVTTYKLYLNTMDDVPATRLAYHGALIMWSTNGLSLSGDLTRIVGKFN